ncbi:sodium/glucose cotransporter 1-like [Saccopteryx bilineata]|uniref:sodium/glucose cotransporter 1-like n=1 Tax=Saccopteryx bilineata TaxID=59482 RepID=UPI00338D4954
MNFPWPGISAAWTALNYDTVNALDIMVMIFFFLLVLGIGLWAMLSSNRATVQDFFLAGRSLAWWLIGASLLASNIGTSHLMTLAASGATSGIAVGAFEWNAAFLLCALGWIFSPLYIKAEVVTMPEYLRKRFGGYRIQLLVAVLFIILCIVHKLSVEICTGSMFMRLILGLDVYLSAIILLTITGIYTVTGGLAAVVYTNTLHAGVTLLGSVLLMGFAFAEVGGYQELWHKYLNAKPTIIHEGNWTAKPECYLPRLDSFHIFRDPIAGDFPWPGVIFGTPILSFYYWCTDQIFVQRCLAGKSLSHVKGGCVFCGYLKLLPMFCIVMPGMISRILYPDKVACVVPSECEKHCGTRTTCSPIAYPLLIIELLPKGARGLMLSALWAALMSSLTSIFNSASTLFTMDIYTHIRPMATEKELMVTGRFFVIILLIVTMFWVPVIQTGHSEQLFDYTHAVMCFLVPPIVAIFMLAVFSKRVTEQGAFWGLIVGLVIGFIRMVSEFAYGPDSCSERNKCPLIICGVHYLYFATLLFVISFFSILGISLLTEPIPDKHLHRLCWSLRNSQEERIDLDAEIQWRRHYRCKVQPGVFLGTQSCLQKALGVICGLDPKPNSKLAPEQIAVEIKKHDATSEKTESSDTSYGTKDDATLESPFWRNVLNTSGLLLILITALCFIIYH